MAHRDGDRREQERQKEKGRWGRKEGRGMEVDRVH